MLGIGLAYFSQHQSHTAATLPPATTITQPELAGSLSSNEIRQPEHTSTNTSASFLTTDNAAIPAAQVKTTLKGMPAGSSKMYVAAINTTAAAAPGAPLNLPETSSKAPSPQKTFFDDGNVWAGFSSAMLPLHQPVNISTNKTAFLTADPVRKLWPDALKPRASKPRAKKAVKNCYDFSHQPSAWMVEAYVGPSLAQRELISSPDDRPYLNKRLSTEKRDLAFNAGVRASLMLKGNFLLRTGLHYDQMTEVFEYIDPEFVRTIVANVYHPSTGLTTLDTVGVEYGEKYQKTFNRFGMLDIPVMVGIEMRKGRSGFNINAGMSFNLLFWKRGAILSPVTGEPAWFTPGKKDADEVFRPRAGLSATASVQWFYHVKPRLRIFVEPSFKKIMRPVTGGQHPVEQRYGIGGLRLGLTKILN